MPPPSLTDEKLVAILDNERMTYSRNYVPLHHTKITNIQKCCKLAAQNPNEIRRNVNKKRACVILSDLWASAPAVFVLCASVLPPNTLGSNASTTYLGTVLNWWNEIDHPKGLMDALQEIGVLKSLPSYDSLVPSLASEAPKETQTTTAISSTTPPTDQSTRIHCEETPLPDGPQHVFKRRRTPEHESGTANLYSINGAPNIPLNMTTTDMLWIAGLNESVPQPDKPALPMTFPAQSVFAFLAQQFGTQQVNLQSDRVDFPFIDIKPDLVAGTPSCRIIMSWETLNELVKSFHQGLV